MVTLSSLRARWSGALALCLVAQASGSPWERLEPAQRAKLLGSLILLTIGGVALVTLCWMALRAGRRKLKRENEALRQLRTRAQQDDWAQKPLSQNEIAEQGDES